MSVLPKRFHTNFRALNVDADAEIRNLIDFASDSAAFSYNIFILVGGTKHRLAVGYFNLAPRADPVETMLALEVLLDEVVVEIVNMALRADKRFGVLFVFVFLGALVGSFAGELFALLAVDVSVNVEFQV